MTQTAQEILKARARLLARAPDAPQTAGESLEVIEFRLAQERYAIEQGQLREVFPLKDLTPLPGLPLFLPGIINVRGRILPVLDIKNFFDLPQTGITDLHVAIIVCAADVELGILADAIIGVRRIAVNDLQPSLPTLTGIRAQYLRGVTADRVVVLDVLKILADPKVVINEEC